MTSRFDLRARNSEIIEFVIIADHRKILAHQKLDHLMLKEVLDKKL